MVKHILVWKLKDGVPEKETLLEETKAALEDLSGKIDGLVSVKVTVSPLPSSSASAMLEAVFDGKEALEEYKNNKRHRAIANEYIKPFSDAVLSADTEE